MPPRQEKKIQHGSVADSLSVDLDNSVTLAYFSYVAFFFKRGSNVGTWVQKQGPKGSTKTRKHDAYARTRARMRAHAHAAEVSQGSCGC